MDSNNWRPPQGDAQPPPIDGGDWRSQLQPDSRQRIVNKIMETLKRHLPFSGQDGLQELKQIAIRFEEKIYSAATSQSDYLRKISQKMLTMESKSQNQLPNAIPSNSAGVSRNPQDPGDAQPPPIDGGDWRSQLQPDSRQRIVNKIMETLKRHLPFSGQDGLQELKQIAIRFEEKIYSAATSQSDYLRKISLKMLTMESKSQNQLPNAIPSNSAGVSRNPQDPGPEPVTGEIEAEKEIEKEGEKEVGGGKGKEKEATTSKGKGKGKKATTSKAKAGLQTRATRSAGKSQTTRRKKKKECVLV